MSGSYHILCLHGIVLLLCIIVTKERLHYQLLPEKEKMAYCSTY